MRSHSAEKLGLNLGPVCTAELATLGVRHIAELRATGWRDIAIRWCEAYPERINLNACRGLIGAELGVDWRQIPAAELAEARALLKQLRRGRDGRSTQ